MRASRLHSLRFQELDERKRLMSDAELSKGSVGSVSGWIAKMRQGDPTAIGQLVARYFQKIAQFAESKLRRGIRVTDDGEDIAISVLHTITRNSAKGRFPDLQDRDDLWFLMIVIAQHAVIDKKRTELRRERQAAPVHTMTDLMELYNVDLEDFLGNDNSASKLLEIIDCWDELLKKLPDDRNREVAKLKMQGYSNREIADILGMVPRTVDRKIRLIAQRWQSYLIES